MLSRLSLEEFTVSLAAGTPTPGGGSAAALAGSLGASLVAMVCALTVGREGYREHDQALQAIASRATTLRSDLLALVDRDAAAYDEVIAALRLPKGTEAEKEARRAALRRANLGATEAPLKAAEACRTVLELAADLLPKGNRNARSDIGSAALLAGAGLQAALMNVRVNLPGLGDPERAAALEASARRLEAEGARFRDSVLRELQS
jgi:formiminotetrahydrofolate cyclodeaminase